MSPAVVIAAGTPSASPRRRPSSLAPRWPPSSGTTALPSSADGDDRRLLALVGESGRESPDQDAGGAHPHDVESVREQPAQLGADVVERDVHVGHTGGISVDAGPGQARPDPSRPRPGPAPSAPRWRPRQSFREPRRSTGVTISAGARVAPFAAGTCSVIAPKATTSDIRRDAAFVRHRNARGVTRSTRHRGRAAGSWRSTARRLRRHRRAAGSSRSPWSRARRSGRSRSGPWPRSRPGPVAGAGRP